MGTRCLTRVLDLDGSELVCMYRQFDGYPSGHGKDLAEWLSPLRLVNGLGGDISNVCNGMDCLAAQMVAHFKKDAGGFYLYPPGSTDCGEEYTYTIYADATGPAARPAPARIMLRVQKDSWTGDTLYDGPVAKFAASEAATA